MKMLLLLFLSTLLLSDKLYFNFCTKDQNVGCLIYKSENGIKSLSAPILQAVNGNVAFLRKEQIKEYSVFLYKIEYKDFLIIEPVKLNNQKSQKMIYSFTDHDYKEFEDFLGYSSFRYEPAQEQRQKFQKNILLSLFLIFPVYFVIVIVYQLSKRNKVLERIGVRHQPTTHEETRRFYRFLMLEGLPEEIEAFNKKIGTYMFYEKTRKKGKKKTTLNTAYVQEAFESFIHRYTGSKKMTAHIKRVFLIYLWSMIVLVSWIYFDDANTVIFVAVLASLFVVWMFLS